MGIAQHAQDSSYHMKRSLLSISCSDRETLKFVFVFFDQGSELDDATVKEDSDVKIHMNRLIQDYSHAAAENSR